ncbi:MAG: phage holin family protein [Bacteroidota bacterium]
MADHARGLADDIKEWAELRIALVQQEVKDKLEEKGTYGGIIAVFAALGGLFLLIALGFGASAVVGIWIENQLVALLLGFLVVALLLLLVAFVAYKKSPFNT